MPSLSGVERPNLLVILIDDLRFDEFGAGGHPYMRTPHVDRLAHEGAMCLNAFHTTPLCSPNRASIVTGQYASRHGIIDNVARDAASHRLPNYHLELQGLGYETAHVGKWHMGNDGSPRPGYDRWVSFDGHGKLFDPEVNVDGRRRAAPGYVTDVLNAEAVAFVERPRSRPWSLFFAHKAVHPDAHQAADGTLDLSRGGYKPAERHRDLYRGSVFPPRPNVLPASEVVQAKPAWDIAPTMIALAGGTPGSHVQGRSLVPLLGGRRPADWRTSFLVEYWSENAMPWLVGMTYKAVRTERAKLIHWVNRDGVDELYDLAADPYELANLIDDPARAREREDLRRELARLVVEALGL